MPKRPRTAMNANDSPLIQGYNATKSEPSPTSPSNPEDPQGEEAYQRAFHDASKIHPLRVPNPLAYPNSPSAQAYIKDRTSRYPQPPKTRVHNSTYVPPPPDIHSKRREPRRRPTDLDDGDSPSPGQTRSSSVSPSMRQEQYLSSQGDSLQSQSQSQIRAPPHSHSHAQHNLPPLPMYGLQHAAPSFSGLNAQHQPSSHSQPGGFRPAGAGPHVMEPQMQAPSGPKNPFARA